MTLDLPTKKKIKFWHLQKVELKDKTFQFGKKGTIEDGEKTKLSNK